MKIYKSTYLTGYLGGIIGGIALIFCGAFIIDDADNPSIGVFLMFAGFAAILIGKIYSLVFLYRIWTFIPRRYASITPGQAVGYLFIPFYNFYWIFRAYRGWVLDFNRYIRAERSTMEPVSEGVALAMCILFVVQLCLSYFASAVVLVLECVFISQACDAINKMGKTERALLMEAEEDGWEEEDEESREWNRERRTLPTSPRDEWTEAGASPKDEKDKEWDGSDFDNWRQRMKQKYNKKPEDD